MNENTDKYLQRGVSASKEDVHKAVAHLDKGLYPNSFCKIFPDYFTQDENYCIAQSSDGSGTKSVLAYLYWKETGDLTVWKSIAQDAIVMNLDDLLCVGATKNFMLSSVINRNKANIPGEVIAAIIAGSQEFVESMNELGISIHFTGGETADLGDAVRTVTVDASMAVRFNRNDLILTQNIKPGQVIVGLASYGKATYEHSYNSGISSNGLTSARHDLLSKYYAENFPETFEPSLNDAVVYCGSKRLTDKLDEQHGNIGKALLSPTRTFAPIIAAIQKEMKGRVKGIINNTGGAFTKVLHYVNGVRIVKDNLIPVPPLFNLIQQESNTDWKEMYKVLNCGTRMELYLEQQDADAIIAIAKSFGIDAQIMGNVEAAEKAEVIVKSEFGQYNYT
jgi:phosphoribosylformylglycinamidine cyclo-ligase